jgi:hypothetical protein
MIATLLATMFAGAAILAVGTMALSWRNFGFRFAELRAELRATHAPVNVRYSWREAAAPLWSATVYSLDFKAKADGLPFHPELGHDLPVAA